MFELATFIILGLLIVVAAISAERLRARARHLERVVSQLNDALLRRQQEAHAYMRELAHVKRQDEPSLLEQVSSADLLTASTQRRYYFFPNLGLALAWAPVRDEARRGFDIGWAWCHEDDGFDEEIARKLLDERLQESKWESGDVIAAGLVLAGGLEKRLETMRPGRSRDTFKLLARVILGNELRIEPACLADASRAIWRVAYSAERAEQQKRELAREHLKRQKALRKLVESRDRWRERARASCRSLSEQGCVREATEDAVRSEPC